MNLNAFNLWFLVFCSVFIGALLKISPKDDIVIDTVDDYKDLKKLLRTKTNVLIMFTSGSKETQPNVRVFRETAEAVKGIGTMVLIDCSQGEKKKICKKLKVSPSPFLLKHYKNGDFHKDYDRQMTVSSMSNFMRDPTGELPWEEDPKGVDVFHIPDYNTFQKYLKKERKPTMVMFYVPWCGYCKRLKPDYSAAAAELKPKYILAAMDVERTVNAMARKVYNITGFPTLLYFEDGKFKSVYDGENSKTGIISFMQDPTAPPALKLKEEDWSADPTSEIVHLTTMGFEPSIKDEKSVLIMFYAPWCGHCKRMKPEYEKAAILMKERNIPGVLAALDATKEGSIAQNYGVKGYPTVKYFINGEYQFDVNVRDAQKIVDFMKDPKEPPPPPPAEIPWDEEVTDVHHLTGENFKQFLKKRKHALVMFYAPWCGHCKKAKPEFSAAASEFLDDSRVALAAVDCTKHSTICSSYDVRGYPTIKYFSYLKNHTDYNGSRTKTDFVNYLRSVHQQAQNNGGGFGKYPGSDKVILIDGSVDRAAATVKFLLVMFYLPSCGRCEIVKPVFAKAASVGTTPETHFGALNCLTYPEEAKKHNVQSYPTIVLFENGKFIDLYDGSWTADDLIQFIRRGSKDEL